MTSSKNGHGNGSPTTTSSCCTRRIRPRADGDTCVWRRPAYPERELERIKRLVVLPPYARGVIVDCGRSVRLLITGTPVGERLLELALGEAPSFDCWVHQEWVREAVFDDADKALRALRNFIAEYLSPEGIAHAESVAARA